MESLQYVNVASLADSSFFTKLADLKLNKLKLDNASIPIRGYMTRANKLNKFNDQPVIRFDYSSFDQIDSKKSDDILMKGDLRNTNTIEEFKAVDKQAFLKEAGQELADIIRDSSDLPSFDCINRFKILVFSDLKKYKFYYWFAFPVLHTSWEIIDKKDVEYDDKFYIDREFISIKNGSISSWDQTNDFIYYDTSLNLHTSSQLRNYLYFLAVKGVKSINLTIYKKNHSCKYSLKLRNFNSETIPKITGWERNLSGKLGPKLADLASLIDPKKLAEQAVDLNLRLMKWRIAPDLDLDIIKDQRILLLGAGTLGTYVSRILMGWGVRQISLVDNGRVSYSNPVRQPLFNFNDCFSENGQGEWKSQRAASALKEIFPGVESTGINLKVPMVGHPISIENEPNEALAFQKLEELFDSHDIVFLLMDSRESRWLPSVLGVAKGKLVINAALGFDSYLVMRHGNLNQPQLGQERLGCYFCNDIVAPDDSLSDRTLDQMCTVTRPGVAPLASSIAVELCQSVLQHSHGKFAQSTPNFNEPCILGDPPHQIRGFLHDFSQLKYSTPAFENCSACSLNIIDAYLKNGWSFVKKCLNDPKYIEEVSGLKEVQVAAEQGALELLEELELDDEHEDVDNFLS